MSGYADAVIGLLDTLGIDKAVIGGMSMGGYVLLDLLERYRTRLLGAMFLVTRAAADDATGKSNSLNSRTPMPAEAPWGSLPLTLNETVYVVSGLNESGAR